MTYKTLLDEKLVEFEVKGDGQIIINGDTRIKDIKEVRLVDLDFICYSPFLRLGMVLYILSTELFQSTNRLRLTLMPTLYITTSLVLSLLYPILSWFCANFLLVWVLRQQSITATRMLYTIRN